MSTHAWYSRLSTMEHWDLLHILNPLLTTAICMHRLDGLPCPPVDITSGSILCTDLQTQKSMMLLSSVLGPILLICP